MCQGCATCTCGTGTPPRRVWTRRWPSTGTSRPTPCWAGGDQSQRAARHVTLCSPPIGQGLPHDGRRGRGRQRVQGGGQVRVATCCLTTYFDFLMFSQNVSREPRAEHDTRTAADTSWWAQSWVLCCHLLLYWVKMSSSPSFFLIKYVVKQKSAKLLWRL